ncbi:MAG: DUF378 domain-containing protein [Patescibacteria group bacterium]
MRNLNALDWIAIILVVIGGLNWGLVGLFNFNLVEAIFGDSTVFMSRLIYILVGFSALYLAAISAYLSKK